MKIDKYSFGLGDRFHHQGEALLRAVIDANRDGLPFVPVFNKSNREHGLVGTRPEDLRNEADAAVKALGWKRNYFVDADHISMKIVDKFISTADFFTLDVTEYIGRKSDDQEISEFIKNNRALVGEIALSDLRSITIGDDVLGETAERFLLASKKAGELYRYIVQKKGHDNFVAEVSMDEVDSAQSPAELLIIARMLADAQVPVQTIAPRFTGRFNKGVDWYGDLSKFEREFEECLLVLDYAVKHFGLPDNLKLSVHSGSDKFSIYPVMGRLLKKHDKGIHIKTAGTTWLEEVTGLALSGGEYLELVQGIYARGVERYDEMVEPYGHVIEIDQARLPDPKTVAGWDARRFVDSLRHVPGHPDYNPDFRQMIHVSYKVAAEYGRVFTDALKKNKDVIAKEVHDNIYQRHLKRIFS